MLLLPNLYGDIVSDLCAGLVGGLGVVPGARTSGSGVGVFEAVHGSAPDIAGKDIANPMALLLSAVLMLRHIGEGAKADRVMAALARCSPTGTVRTRDLGGTATTTAFADAMCRGHRAGRVAVTPVSSSCYQSRPWRCWTKSPGRAWPARSRADIWPAATATAVEAARERIKAYLDELRTTQRYELYRALKHPLYLILRKIERIGENIEARRWRPRAAPRRLCLQPSQPHRLSRRAAGARRQRHPAADHRRRHQYVRRPARPDPQHVTGAMPIRRNTKDPAYLITLKAYVAELLRKHDLFFYPEGGRSYSGELKTPEDRTVQRGAARAACRTS